MCTFDQLLVLFSGPQLYLLLATGLALIPCNEEAGSHRVGIQCGAC